MRVLVWACGSHLSRRGAQMKLTPLISRPRREQRRVPMDFVQEACVQRVKEREDLDWKWTLTLQERGRPPTSRSHRILESPSDGSARQSAHNDT